MSCFLRADLEKLEDLQDPESETATSIRTAAKTFLAQKEVAPWVRETNAKDVSPFVLASCWGQSLEGERLSGQWLGLASASAKPLCAKSHRRRWCLGRHLASAKPALAEDELTSKRSRTQLQTV